MALSDAYATAAEYRAVIKPDADAAGDAAILSDLKAISRYLEGKLGRFFNKESADSTLYFAPSDASDRFEIGDYSAVPTSITVDDDGDGTPETVLATTDYELWPLNAALEPEPQPYTQLVLPTWGTRGYWAAGARIKVVGKRGWPAVPEPVKSATIRLTAILRLESPLATRRIPEMGESIESSPDAQRIVRYLTEQYKRWIFA